MPKDTFNKLPIEKRNSILNAAVKEFELRRVEDAVIANIIKTAKIPRGSFYQYFEDKYDLYEYIIGYINNIKNDYFQEVFFSDHLPFLERVRALYNKAIDFSSQNKAFVLISKRHTESIYVKYSEQFQRNLNELKVTFDTWIEKDKEKGLIRKDIDTRVLSHMISTFLSHLTTEQFLYEKYSKSELHQKNDDFIDIIMNGSKGHN